LDPLMTAEGTVGAPTCLITIVFSIRFFHASLVYMNFPSSHVKKLLIFIRGKGLPLPWYLFGTECIGTTTSHLSGPDSCRDQTFNYFSDSDEIPIQLV
jgi:hypothetical protein